jgi:CheY-like chemotaxis protein/anti-sigma regulatory factor (Ser/Thr protein kinase)
LLKESANLTLSGSNTLCEFTISEDIWSIEGDEGQLSQVFSNLLINADQAMPDGGIIKVRMENDLVAEDSNLPLTPGKYLKITIIDQGVGISHQYFDKIFDPYFSTKKRGSGLGLATAYSIIKNHSGHIQVESQVGVGSTFTVYLPAIEVEASIGGLETLELLRGHGRILVMDDEEMIREVIEKMLDRLGYQMEFAKDGSEAVEKFAVAKGMSQPFDAVIIDLTIPAGKGGQETIKELLEIDPQLKAIVSSGYSDDRIMADFRSYGFCAVIPKPYRISDLGEVLHNVISKKLSE